MKKSVRDTVREAILPTVTELGYRIWDITYAKIGADYHLEITIDHPDGIDIDDCEKVHRAIDPLLDEADPIQDAYYLEVSSPGVERVLRTMEHFAQCVGQKAQIKLYKAIDGRKSLIGIITECDKEDTVAIAEGDKVTEIPLESIAKANIVFDFE